MNPRILSLRLALAAFVLSVVACQDAESPIAPPDVDPTAQFSRGQAVQQQQMEQWFRRATPEVLALPQTVFSDHDESANRLVFGVENANVVRGVEVVLSNLGIPASAYEVRVTEPIRFLATLQEKHQTTVGGIQIHFSNYLCTLGFNVDHAGGRSFITNSHCTGQQGQTDGTAYYQPLSSVDPNPIAFEVDDPAYFRGAPCPRGKKCRYSDAARALYESGIVNLGEIAKPSGLVNSGDLTFDGTLTFDIATQDNNTTDLFSGTLHKVGRTTGWTQGDVTRDCTTVNVSGTNIALLCQTLVQNSGIQIVGGGDSGSPVFRKTGLNTAELVGILWGGNSSGDMFVFSPLKNIQDELGSLTATTDGIGGGGDNLPPTASFTVTSCTELTCSFDGSGSDDPDGNITSYDWTFGDGGTGTGLTPSHTYATGGPYEVTLTVTDNEGATGTFSEDVTVGSTGDFTLTATGYKFRGLQKADLEWFGATSANVNLYRDGTLIGTTANDGNHTDNINERGGGSYTYQLCEAETSTCSNEATVIF